MTITHLLLPFSDRSKDGDLCYREMDWIAVYMNNPSVKRAVGASPNVDFASCNMEVNQAFFGQGDGMHNSAKLLPELIDDDIKLLVYAGNADAMCNFIVSPNSLLCHLCHLIAYMLIVARG